MTYGTLITGVAICIAIAVIALFFIFANPFSSGNELIQQTGSAAQGSATQLVIQDQVVGTGAEARVGDTITVNYTGTFQDGRVFDTSVGREPFVFTLGAGQVIQGWDQGLAGMKVGGKRLLIIPAVLAYGSQGSGPIPPNTPLVFEVELLDAVPQGQ